MRWGILLILVFALLGCTPTGGGPGPASTGTVYPYPRRATWNEEVQVRVYWRALVPAVKLAGIPLDARVEADKVVFKVPAGVWGGPQKLEVSEGAEQAVGSLTVLGESVFGQPEPGAFAILQPSVSDTGFELKIAPAGLRLLPMNAAGDTSIPLGGAAGPCAGRLVRVAPGAASLAAGELLERLERFGGGGVVDLDGILGIDPVTGYDIDPAASMPSPGSLVIQARKAVNAKDNSNYTGAGVNIAIIDSGVAVLPELNLLPGQDYTQPEDPQPNLDNYGEGVGHGSAVASLAADKAYGIAPGASILPIKSCDKLGNCQLGRVIQGICRATAYSEASKKPMVINLSLGSDTPSEIMYIVLKDALARGISVVSAAGNQWAMRSRKAGVLFHYPAAFGGSRGLWRQARESMAVLSGLIGVGSAGNYGVWKASPFSENGDFVHLVAPGERVLSLSSSSGELEYSGTSFATPLVAGTVALLRQTGATPLAAKRVLLENLTRSITGEPEAIGVGLLDLTNAP
jgi:subtilisin